MKFIETYSNINVLNSYAKEIGLHLRSTCYDNEYGIYSKGFFGYLLATLNIKNKEFKIQYTKQKHERKLIELGLELEENAAFGKMSVTLEYTGKHRLGDINV